jgi:ABC-type multidrug transport system fused ATPase/permease subunit
VTLQAPSVAVIKKTANLAVLAPGGRPPGTPCPSPAVVFRDVVKVYDGRVTALDHASFENARGETVALLGPDGAGKSTAGQFSMS